MADRDDSATSQDEEAVHYEGPTGGWRSLTSITRIFGKEVDGPSALDLLRRQNKPEGFMCVSCAWTKPKDYHVAEFCENGAKATLWERTTRRADAYFFAEHTVGELKGWSVDMAKAMSERLGVPFKFEATSFDVIIPGLASKRYDAGFSSFGMSAIRASEVSSRVLTLAAFWRAERVTLVGSMMPALTRSVYSSRRAS